MYLSMCMCIYACVRVSTRARLSAFLDCGRICDTHITCGGLISHLLLTAIGLTRKISVFGRSLAPFSKAVMHAVMRRAHNTA